MLKAQGHRAFKAKIGGASLDEDMARLRVIREVIGDEDELMLDVNGAWDLPTAIEGARLRAASWSRSRTQNAIRSRRNCSRTRPASKTGRSI